MRVHRALQIISRLFLRETRLLQCPCTLIHDESYHLSAFERDSHLIDALLHGIRRRGTALGLFTHKCLFPIERLQTLLQLPGIGVESRSLGLESFGFFLRARELRQHLHILHS